MSRRIAVPHPRPVSKPLTFCFSGINTGLKLPCIEEREDPPISVAPSILKVTSCNPVVHKSTFPIPSGTPSSSPLDDGDMSDCETIEYLLDQLTDLRTAFGDKCPADVKVLCVMLTYITENIFDSDQIQSLIDEYNFSLKNSS